MLSHARPFDGFKELFFGFISFAQDPSRVYNLQDKKCGPKKKIFDSGKSKLEGQQVPRVQVQVFSFAFSFEKCVSPLPLCFLPMIVQQARNAHKDDVSQKESNGQNYYNKPSVTTSCNNSIQSGDTSWLLNFFKEISNSNKKWEQEDAQ